jgi:hypothetical protein
MPVCAWAQMPKMFPLKKESIGVSSDVVTNSTVG